MTSKENQDKNKAFDILNKLCEDQTNLIGKYQKAIEILKHYIKYCTEVDFDTYVTSQCTDEEQDLLKEVLSSVTR